jgi:hypothetical protein
MMGIFFSVIIMNIVRKLVYLVTIKKYHLQENQKRERSLAFKIA